MTRHLSAFAVGSWIPLADDMNFNDYAGDYMLEAGKKKPPGVLMEREESQKGYLQPPTGSSS